jgi:hypothetical protein
MAEISLSSDESLFTDYRPDYMRIRTTCSFGGFEVLDNQENIIISINQTLDKDVWHEYTLTSLYNGPADGAHNYDIKYMNFYGGVGGEFVSDIKFGPQQPETTPQ